MLCFCASLHGQQALWRRKVTVLKEMGRIDKAVEELSELLDIFYSDVDGWVELAEIYYMCNQYVVFTPSFA
jgi:ER membrane protein complex subunit 2